MKNCECEHVMHGTIETARHVAPATHVIDTIYGKFNVCETCCHERHMEDEKNPEKIVFPNSANRDDGPIINEIKGELNDWYDGVITDQELVERVAMVMDKFVTNKEVKQ